MQLYEDSMVWVTTCAFVYEGKIGSYHRPSLRDISMWTFETVSVPRYRTISTSTPAKEKFHAKHFYAGEGKNKTVSELSHLIVDNRNYPSIRSV